VANRRPAFPVTPLRFGLLRLHFRPQFLGNRRNPRSVTPVNLRRHLARHRKGKQALLHPSLRFEDIALAFYPTSSRDHRAARISRSCIRGRSRDISRWLSDTSDTRPVTDFIESFTFETALESLAGRGTITETASDFLTVRR